MDKELMAEAINSAKATGTQLDVDASLDDVRERRSDGERVHDALGGGYQSSEMRPGVLEQLTTGHTDLPGGSSAQEIAAA